MNVPRLGMLCMVVLAAVGCDSGVAPRAAKPAPDEEVDAPTPAVPLTPDAAPQVASVPPAPPEVAPVSSPAPAPPTSAPPASSTSPADPGRRSFTDADLQRYHQDEPQEAQPSAELAEIPPFAGSAPPAPEQTRESRRAEREAELQARMQELQEEKRRGLSQIVGSNELSSSQIDEQKRNEREMRETQQELDESRR